jgi:hypothetical protein
MALTHSDGLANFVNDNGIQTAFDGGTGRLAILSGAPVAANSAQTGTVLATFTLPSDVFATSAARGVALNAVSNVTASAGGTAGSFIIYRTGDTAIGSAAAAGDRRITGSVATSGGDMTIDNTTIVSGGTVVVSGWTWNFPA